ncbi:MAG: hypothetical protein AAFQ41_07980 [Cyanobacteria bacterium J06623_7]
MDRSQSIEDFVGLSMVVTGFSRFDIYGTGQVSAYYEAIAKVIGQDILNELLTTFNTFYESTKDNPSALDKKMRIEIFGSEKLGPIARNIIKLWYIATWYQLPQAWRDRFGIKPNDVTFVVSPQAYPEGLLWSAIGVNPPAAKPPGYGSWANPPLVTLK